jgi:hypothetical protein
MGEELQRVKERQAIIVKGIKEARQELGKVMLEFHQKRQEEEVKYMLAKVEARY